MIDTIGKQKILVFGCNGQVGYELMRTLAPLGDTCGLTRRECDLSKPIALRNVLNAYSPTVIVNAAAYTAVDRAESEECLARAVNADAPALMAEWAASHGALMMHFSTDYVFDGSKRTPWTEDDPPNPLNIYGKTKLEGDIGVLNSGCVCLIFRTSWVYALRGKNFKLTMEKLLRERDVVKVVNDQYGAPTICCTPALAAASALSRALASCDSAELRALSGVYNVTDLGATTWYGFALAIREKMRRDAPTLRLAEVLPIRSEEYPTAAVRPKYSVLSCEKLRRVFGFVPPRRFYPPTGYQP